VFTLGDTVTICVIVFAAGGSYALLKKDVIFIKIVLSYWFGSGKEGEEGSGIKRLKLYIQQELSVMDKRYEERFIILERRVKALEEIAGLIEKAQQYEFKINKHRNNKHK